MQEKPRRHCPTVVARMSETVTGQLLRLCLQPHSGKIDGGWCLLEAFHAAALVDLAEIGRVRPDEGMPMLDPTATGLEPIDALVVSWLGHRDQSLRGAIIQDRPRLGELAAAMIEDGVWSSRQSTFGRDARYADLDPQAADRLRQAVKAIVAHNDVPSSPRHAVLGALAWATQIVWVHGAAPPPEPLIRSCGGLEWIVRDVAAHLHRICLETSIKRERKAVRRVGPL